MNDRPYVDDRLQRFNKRLKSLQEPFERATRRSLRQTPDTAQVSESYLEVLEDVSKHVNKWGLESAQLQLNYQLGHLEDRRNRRRPLEPGETVTTYSLSCDAELRAARDAVKLLDDILGEHKDPSKRHWVLDAEGEEARGYKK
ncbi:hypothetical protein ACFL0V_01965 [Nanoarchaeota archaeon]